MASYIAALAAVAVPSALFFARSSTLAAAEPGRAAILVTGCSSGIGLATVKKLSSLGVTVFATVRKQSDAAAIREDNIVPFICDVAIKEDVVRLRDEVEEALRKRPALSLSGVVNNAGILLDEPDPLSIDTLERTLAVNVVGVYRVTETFMPLLMETAATAPGSARVVTIGSYFGSFLPGSAVPSYSASKFALEPLSDGWRRRLSAKGVHVALVKPGNVESKMNSKYAEGGSDPVAEAISHALLDQRPRTRYYPATFGGLPNRVACAIFPRLPDRVADAFWKRMIG